MAKEVIIYHMNSTTFKIPEKINGIYEGCKFLWGHILTNKCDRTEEEFAVKFESKGRYRTKISRVDFEWFKSKCEHVYIDDNLNKINIELIAKQIRCLNPIDRIMLNKLLAESEPRPRIKYQRSEEQQEKKCGRCYVQIITEE